MGSAGGGKSIEGIAEGGKSVGEVQQGVRVLGEAGSAGEVPCSPCSFTFSLETFFSNPTHYESLLRPPSAFQKPHNPPAAHMSNCCPAQAFWVPLSIGFCLDNFAKSLTDPCTQANFFGGG